MPDIYNRATDSLGGAFAADQATVSFPAVLDAAGNAVAADIGLLVQRLNTAYSQQVSRLYEVGRPSIYYVGGRTAGDVAMDRVVGPRVISTEFYNTYGDICRAKTNTLHFNIATGCHGASSNFNGFVDYTCYFCVITSIGLGVAAADMLINESLRLMFSSFEYKEGGSPSNGAFSRNTSSLAPQVGFTSSSLAA